MPVEVAAPAPRIPGVEDGLLLVEGEIHRWVTSSQVEFLNQETKRLFAAGGKRLRSALTLAMTVALGGSINDKAVTAATSVEIVHAGSLVHDDLMDNTSCSPAPGRRRCRCRGRWPRSSRGPSSS
jgi:hypothetical protein